jgi:hypothetical protein
MWRALRETLKNIAPHIPAIDKSKPEDGSLSRKDFTFDRDRRGHAGRTKDRKKK